MSKTFSAIYRDNIWRNEESKSGPSSTIAATAGLRNELPSLIQEFGIKSILDAPCGDLNWMSHFLASVPEIQYTGGDIVQDLIQENRRRFSSHPWDFLVIDICEDHLPTADMMIVRDCLFHLTFADIDRFVKNFLRSDIPYLLVTGFDVPQSFENRDIRAGDFRPLSLYHFPVNFPDTALRVIDEGRVREGCRKNISLFSKSDLSKHFQSSPQ